MLAMWCRKLLVLLAVYSHLLTAYLAGLIPQVVAQALFHEIDDFWLCAGIGMETPLAYSLTVDILLLCLARIQVGAAVQVRYDILNSIDEGFSSQGIRFNGSTPAVYKVRLYRYL